MVYSSDRQPAFRDGEKTELLQPEIKIKVSSRKHNLDEDSRLNYAKLYTVEHNVRVCFIGEVDRRYMGRLVDTYNSINPPIDYDSTYQNHGVSSTSSGAQPSSWTPTATQTEGYTPEEDNADLYGAEN